MSKHLINVEFVVEVDGPFTATEAEQIMAEGLPMPSNYVQGTLDVWASPVKREPTREELVEEFIESTGGKLHAVHH